MSRPLTLLVLLALVFGVSNSASGGDGNWPQWRGADMSGVAADDPALPEKWSPTENVAWKTPIPGLGWSSPIVWGDRVFVTAVSAEVDGEAPRKGMYLPNNATKNASGKHVWKVYCVDLATGKIRWERTAHDGPAPSTRHPKNSFASETPITDGERLYVVFGNIGIFAYTLDGKPLWSERMDAQNDEWGWGPGASPVLVGNQLVMVYDNDTTSSSIVAYDVRTGKVNWRSDRDEGHNWATPFVWKNSLRTEIVTAGEKRVRSYDTSGKLLWQFSGRMTDVSVPTPVAAHGMVYVSSGYIGNDHRPAYAVRPGASGDITVKFGEETSPYVAWYQPRIGSYNPSPIVYGDYYYTLIDAGFLTAHDARTGQEVYGRQRIEPGATFTSSPIAYNGKLFLVSEDGNTYVIQAGPEYKLLGKNPLDEMTLASPAVAGKTLLIRTMSHLYAIKKDRD